MEEDVGLVVDRTELSKGRVRRERKGRLVWGRRSQAVVSEVVPSEGSLS